MNGGTEMDVREKLVEQLREVASKTPPICRYDNPDEIEHFGKTITVYCKPFEQFQELMRDAADYIANGITVQEWINSEEMLPEFPCLAIDVNGNSVFIPDGILTIKDKHGEWCINSSLAKEVRLIDGTKMDALIWENRIAYWMPIPQPPKGE